MTLGKPVTVSDFWIDSDGIALRVGTFACLFCGVAKPTKWRKKWLKWKCKHASMRVRVKR